MSRWRARDAVVFSCVALAGCGGHALNVGSSDGGVARDAATTPALPYFPADAFTPGDQVWIGHFADHQLPNGSDELMMALAFAADGTVTGSLLLGSGSVLQPPTDPNVGYPPGMQFSSGLTFVEGFPYTILDGIMMDSRLTFHVAQNEVWTAWCALQTSYLQQRGSDSGLPGASTDFYGCLRLGPIGGTFGVSPEGCFAFDPNTMQRTAVDCGKFELCPSACECSETGCRVRTSPNPDLSLDLVLAGTSADGSTSGVFGNYRVHFSEAP
jgi:hypothetical protein